MKRINKKFIKSKLLIMMFSVIFLLVALMVNAFSSFAMSSSGTDKWVAGQWDSGIYTTKMTEGMFLRRLVNYTTGEQYTTFCSQFLVESPVGIIESAVSSRPSDSKVKDACKVAYLGWYSKYGNYVINGSTMSDRGKVLDFVFTQQFIWETLRQEPGEFRDSKIQQDYEKFKNDIKQKMDNLKKRPSFIKETIEIDVGTTKTLTDMNGVLKDYNSIDKTVDGVRIVHKKGSNTMEITIDESCELETLKVNDAMFKDWGMIKEETKDYDTTVYLTFREGVQNQLYALNYNDPVTMSLNLKINSEGTLEILKKDNKGNHIPETSFKLSYNSNMSEDIGIYTTNAEGKIIVDKLKSGKVYVQEISVPNNLILDNEIKEVIIEPSETTFLEVENKWKQGYIKVVKKDSESDKIIQQSGVEFDIYNSNNQKVTSIITNSEGTAVSGLLDYGSYYIKETKAPNKYSVQSENSDKIDVFENGKTYEITVYNNKVKGTVAISKEDLKTGKVAQGEGTLKGAIYGVYTRNTICDPADNSVIYNINDKVGELVTDENANARLDNLYLGEYYIKEIKASEGYTLDETEYNFNLTYENQNVNVVTKSLTVKERVKSQAFKILKISSDDNGEGEFLEGAEFTIKAQKDINKFGSWEKAPIAKNANGENASILVTDSNGSAISDRLPYGTYIVRETKVPSDKYKVPDFKVVISEDSDEAQNWRVFNDTSFKSVLAIVKIDAETQKVIKVSGAKFKIKNIETDEYFGYWDWNPLPKYIDSWETDNTGTVMTGEQLPVGKYQLEELKAPEGYLISNVPVKFEISSNIAYETLPDSSTPVITVKQKDSAVKGKINVEKKGEVLVDYKDGKFIYEEKGIANAKYEIFARENILEASNNGTILYKKGAVVDTVITNNEGKATTKELPLGEYALREVKSPEGFVLSDEIKEVSLQYKDQNTAIVYNNVSFINERQKVEISVDKKDYDTDVAILGAEFSLYAEKNIKNYNNEIVVNKGQLLEIATSDVNGKVIFKADLPLSNYMIKETQTPKGYVSNSEIIEVNANYIGQDIKVIKTEYEIKNKVTKVEISKQDITDSSELEGANLIVFEKDNEEVIIDKWTSSKKPHIIKGLEVGKTYILREMISPYGYAISQDVEFTVKDSNKIQKVVMKDELVYGKLQFNKTGEIFNQVVTGQTEYGQTESPIWNKSNIPHAEITIYANEDIVIGNTTYYQKNEIVQVIESDLEVVESDKLPVGSYYYMETQVPHGFIADTNKHYFTIEDTKTNEIQTIKSTLENDRQKFNVDMKKALETQELFINEEAYKDIVFGIYAREDILDYMGNTAIKKETMISTTGITEDGNLENVPDLPEGKYYIKELATNKQYVLSEKEYDFEVKYKGKDVTEYVIQIGENGTVDNELARGIIQVRKIDILDENKILENIEFNISNKKDMSNIIATEKTTNEGIATFINLELGKYYIQEKEQVNGYILNDTVYEIEIKQDGDILVITCENKPTEIEFSKVDETGVQEIEGATIQIIDKETNEIVDEWISTNESHIVNYLVEGKEYIMKEIIAPYGYQIAEEITFVMGDNIKVTMKNNPIVKNLQLTKIDKETKDIIKDKFTFGLYVDKECTQLIQQMDSNAKEGTITFKDVRYGTYYIKEISAPTEYILSDKVIKVEISDKGVFVNKKEIKEDNFLYNFEVENKKIETPKTGDESNILICFVLFIVSAITFVLLTIYKFKKDVKNKSDK